MIKFADMAVLSFIILLMGVLLYTMPSQPEKRKEVETVCKETSLRTYSRNGTLQMVYDCGDYNAP